MSRFRLATAFAAVAFTVLAGCGSSDSPTASAGTSPTSEQKRPAASATVQLRKTSLGDVLVDAKGMTLYLFMKDSDGKSACTGACASVWPALLATGEPTAGTGLEDEDLGTITRDDGGMQVTYYGHPLYTYAPDTKPGDVTGQGVGGVWFAVTAAGSAAGSQPSTSGGGGY